MHNRTILMMTGCAVALVAVAGAGCKEKESAVETTVPQTEVATAPVAMSASTMDAPQGNVVTVNDESLTRAELEKELRMISASPQFAQLPPEQAQMMLQQMEARVIDRFVSQQVLSAAAQQEGKEATDEEIDEFLDGIRETLPEGVTLDSILQERDLTMASLREDIASDIKIRKLLDEKTESVGAVSDEQVKAFYAENSEMFEMPESVHARHILISAEGEDEEAMAAARAEIEAIREKLVAGELTFTEAAEEHSACPSSQSGGDLGTFSRGQMVPAFEEAAFTQEPGAIGPVIETQFGFHIVEVVERIEAGKHELADVKDDIREQLEMQAKQEVVQDYIEALSEEADITYGE